MKFHILFQFVEGPYGGGNQFLKALRAAWRQQGLYAEKVFEADCCLVNANPAALPYLLPIMLQLQRKNPRQTFLVRLDGPTSLVRGKDAYLDRLLTKFVHLYADGLIWQSQWSRKQNKKLYGTTAPLETVIHNAPDSTLFFPAVMASNTNIPLRIIATSWSKNPRKGFAIYTYLDQHLDFSKYQFTFVGNTPVSFRNIKIIPPVISKDLADILRQQHVYITASYHDPCSNALLEAIACGLPVVARRSGGHPELVRRGGEFFTDENNVISALERVCSNIPHYRAQLPRYSIDETAAAYRIFAQQLQSRPGSWRQSMIGAMVYSQYYGYQFGKSFSRNE